MRASKTRFRVFDVLGFRDHLGLLREIGHPLLGGRRSDDVSGQVFCGYYLSAVLPLKRRRIIFNQGSIQRRIEK
jgi:hypothetical protein